MAIERPVRLWRAQPQPGQHLPLQLTAGALGWLQVISGSAALKLPAAEPTPGLQAGADGADLLLFELA